MEPIEEALLLSPPPKKEIDFGLPLPPQKIILGIEYVDLQTKRKPTTKQKRKIDHTIDRLKDISEDEIKAVYEGMGAAVYLPTFREYLQTFWDTIKDETKIKADFALFKNASVWERFMLNTCQFSAAKSVAINGMIKAQLFDEDGVRKGFSKFKSDCKEITDIVNETWFRTEYDSGVRQAVAGDMFRSFKDDADIYEYWQYLETTSANPRDSHLALVGNIYRIGDPEGDSVFPPGGWNCGCGAEQVDQQFLDENNKSARTTQEAAEDLENHVDQQFRFDPSKEGILPKTGHSYFQALPDANSANGETFGITNTTAQKTKLSAKGMHQLVELFHTWRIKYHSNGIDEVTFQCKPLLSNVVFNHKSLVAIAKHAFGTDNLADTIIDPSEVWSKWIDPNTQKDVKRYYLKGNYCVETVNGIVIDAHYVDNINRFRSGVIIL